MQMTSIVTSDQKELQPQEDKTQQLRLAEYWGGGIQLIESWAGESLKGNLPEEEEASCLLLKCVRVQGV